MIKTNAQIAKLIIRWSWDNADIISCWDAETSNLTILAMIVFLLLNSKATVAVFQTAHNIMTSAVSVALVDIS